MAKSLVRNRYRLINTKLNDAIVRQSVGVYSGSMRVRGLVHVPVSVLPQPKELDHGTSTRI